MASAAEMLRRLKSVSKITTLREMVYQHVLDNSDRLVRIKEQEYEVGNIFSDGIAYYSPTSSYEANEIRNFETYAEFKLWWNPLARGKVDLIYEGGFINSFFVKKQGKGFIFDATDWKKDRLTQKYNKGNRNILSFNQDKFNEFQKDIIAPLFIKDLKQKINGR